MFISVLLCFKNITPFGSTKKWLIIKQLSAILVLLAN